LIQSDEKEHMVATVLGFFPQIWKYICGATSTVKPFQYITDSGVNLPFYPSGVSKSSNGLSGCNSGGARSLVLSGG